MERAILKYQREARKHNSRITGAFNEGIMGAMTTKTLVYEEDNAKEFKEITGSMRKASIKAALINAAFFPLVISLGAVGTSLALYLGGKGVLDPGHAFIGEISAGTLVAFITYAASLFDPIQQFASIFADFQSAQASAERVIGLIDAPIEVQDRPEVVAQYGDVIHPKRENWEPITGSIRFEHVDFGYENSPQMLFDIDFTLPAGTTLGILGGTGSGKSTMMALLDKLYPVEEGKGRITIGGVDIRRIRTEHLRRNIGMVLQEPYLFSRTLEENIAITRPELSREEVREAARAACLDETIEGFAKGYETFVGERGVTLSGGQKQRAAIARTLTQNTPIMIFDDSLSAVDTETDAKIRAALQKRFGTASVILISHRITTLSRADQILVLDKGRIVERGSHDELKQAGGIYQKIYEIQSGAGEEAAV
jgi:ABC-type multidrug transport system, ATPase and permease components